MPLYQVGCPNCSRVTFHTADSDVSAIDAHNKTIHHQNSAAGWKKMMSDISKKPNKKTEK
jgi:hypothetical protein